MLYRDIHPGDVVDTGNERVYLILKVIYSAEYENTMLIDFLDLNDGSYLDEIPYNSLEECLWVKV